MRSKRGDPPAARRGTGSKATRAEITLATVAVASWIVAALGLSGSIDLSAHVSEFAAAAAAVSTVAAFIMSGRSHPSGPQPRSIPGRMLAWAILLMTLLGIGHMLVIAWGMRNWTF